jgi:drug/metabolite transporter (DMT)-like permease
VTSVGTPSGLGAPRFDVRAYLALVGLALIWGYTWVVIKIATADVTPFVLVAMRTVIGAVVMFGLVAAMRRPLRSPAVLPTVAAALLNVAGFYLLQTLAVESSGAGRSAVLAYTYPFWTALLAWPLLGDRITWRMWLGLVLAAVGLGFVLAPIDLVHDPAGKFFAVLTAIEWSFAAIYSKWYRSRHRVDLVAFTAWQTLYAAIPLLAIAASAPDQHLHLTASFLWALGYIGIFGTGFGLLLWLYALSRLQTAAASLASLLTPVVAVLVASFQLAEIPSRNEIVGIVLILGALAVNAARNSSEPRRKA